MGLPPRVLSESMEDIGADALYWKWVVPTAVLVLTVVDYMGGLGQGLHQWDQGRA